MKTSKTFVESRLAAALAVAVLISACPSGAHVLGGGGRPSSSGTGSSGGSSAGDAAAGSSSAPTDPWSKLDPPPGKNAAAPGGIGTDGGGLSAQLQAMRDNCGTLEPSLRETCYGQVAAGAAAAAGAAQAINSIGAQNGKAESSGALDRARNAEAERLKATRAECDAQDPSQREDCYARIQIDHEKWHELNEPMGGASEMTDFKKLREAREKCLKLPQAKKRRQCLKDLYKKKPRSTQPAEPDAAH
ncbi:MAG: hypothetical protein ACHQ51_08270 [Elusimicrobiota bacterium]